MVSKLPVLLALLAAASPAASQTSVREIVEVVDISGLTVSPDGQWVGYRIERPSTDTNRIDVDWYAAQIDGMGKPIHLGRSGTAMWNDAGVVIPGEAQWAPESDSLFVRALVDGKIGVWRARLDGPSFALFAGGDRDIEAFKILPNATLVTREGPERADIAQAEERERERGILADVRLDLAQPVYRGMSINGRPSSQRFTGDWFDRAPLLAGAPRTFAARDLVSGFARSATIDEVAALTPPPSAVIAPALQKLIERSGICVNGAGCLPAASRVSSHIALDNGRTIVTSIGRANRQTLFMASPKSNRLTPFATSDGLLSGGRSENRPCAVARDAIFCVEASPSMPPRLVRVAFDGAKTVIDAPNGASDGDGLLADSIAWQVGGSRASGVLIRPKIPGRLPLFVTYYHCAGYLRGGTGDEWPLRALAANGIAALCVEVMPGGDNAIARYNIGLDVVRAAISDLDRRGIIDPDRVGMGGLSFGSEVTMWTAMHSNLLKAVSIASVQIEPSYYWFNARPERASFTDSIRQNWGLGPPDKEPAGWQNLSAALNIEKIHAPVLMQMPESEARQSTELQAKLALARMGEMHVFPLAPHIKVEPRQKLAAYVRNLDWFRFWLKGEVDPDPAKADQYQRWRMLGPKDAASTDRTQRSMSTISSNRR